MTQTLVGVDLDLKKPGKAIIASGPSSNAGECHGPALPVVLT